MRACPGIEASGITITHIIKDMALIALELHLVVECLYFLFSQLGDVGFARVYQHGPNVFLSRLLGV